MRITVVPTEAHVERVLADSAAESSVVVPWRRFVLATLRQVEPEARVATAADLRLAARAALDDVPDGDAARLIPPDERGRMALATEIDRAIGALRKAGVDARALGSVTSPRGRLTRAVLDRVDRRLDDRRLLDPRAAGERLSRRLAASSVPAAWQELTALGIVDWESDDLTALEALHRALRERGGRGVTVVLPHLAVDDPRASVADALERRWAPLSSAPELRWQALGADDEPGRARIYEARNVDGEARAVVGALSHELAGGGSPERIAVVVPDLDEAFLGPLRALLEDAGIPFSEPIGRPVTASPEAAAALGLLELAAGPLSRDLLVEVLRAPGLHAGAWMNVRGERDAARRGAALSHRLRQLPFESDHDGEAVLRALRHATRPEERWMVQALEQILSTLEWLKSAPSRRMLCERLLRTFERHKLGTPSANELGDALAIHDDRARAAALAALGHGAGALRALRQAIEDAGGAGERLGLPDRPADPDGLRAELVAALPTLRAAPPGGAARAGAVRVARPFELAGLGLDAVVIARADAERYGASDEDDWLDDHLSTELPAILRPRGPVERARVRALQLEWLAQKSRVVVFTRTLGDAVSEPVSPLSLVVRALEAGAAHQLEPASRLFPSASVSSPRHRHLAAVSRRGAVVTSDLARRVDIERERSTFFLEPRHPAGPHTGRIDEALLPHLRACLGGAEPTHSLPVTSLERLATCAFAGFSARALGLGRQDDRTEAASARDRGTLVHQALHACFRASGGLEPGPQRDDIARRAAREELGLDAVSSPLRREALASAVEDALAVLHFYDGQRDGLDFAFGEQRFGVECEAPWGPLELVDTATGRALYLDGRIDRIDATADRRRLRVIDYKTGSGAAASAFGRTGLQIPLYAVVASRLGRSDATEAGAATTDVELAVVIVRPGGVVAARSPRGESTADLVASASARALEAALRVFDGDVSPRPVSPKACARCDARDLCRRPAVMPIEDSASEEDV